MKRVPLINRIDYDLNTGCWNWIGSKSDGYGKCVYQGKPVKANRLSAHLFMGFPLDSPLRVLHRCDNPACFNPKHLFIGTDSDNQRDAVNKCRHPKTQVSQCPRGHLYSEANTAVRIRKSNGRTFRVCRICKRRADHARRADAMGGEP